MALFGPKIFRIDVIHGVDLEEHVYLQGSKITVGSHGNDDLTLVGDRIVAEHVTFVPGSNGKGWEYYTSGAGLVETNRGNPRSGKVGAGLVMTLGTDTKIKISQVAAPEELREEAASAESTEIPLSTAIVILLALVVGFGVFISVFLGGSGSSGSSLATSGYYNRTQDLAGALDTCLEEAGEETARLVPAGSPDAMFRRYSAAVVSDDTDTMAEMRLQIGRMLRRTIVDAHLMITQGEHQKAADKLREISLALPIDNSPCPIRSAARRDSAVLDRMAN